MRSWPKRAKTCVKLSDGKTKTTNAGATGKHARAAQSASEDGKAQGVALTELAELLLSLEDPGAKFVAAELLIRAGIEATLYDDDPADESKRPEGCCSPIARSGISRSW